MDPIKIDRLNEHHDDATQWSDELLNMSVKELLDRVEASDTEEDSRYEAVEELILSLKDRILTPGEYDSPDALDFEGMEGDDDTEEFGGDDYSDDLPSFSDVTANMQDTDSIDTFEF